MTSGELGDRLARLIREARNLEETIDGRVDSVQQALYDPEVADSADAVREATANELTDLRLAMFGLGAVASDLEALELDLFTDGMDAA